MWFRIQIAAYTTVVLGYALLLLLAFRHRLGRGAAERRLETLLLLSGVWTLALGALSFVGDGRWWAYLWRRIGEVGLIVLALLTAEFASVFVRQERRRWVAWSLTVLLAAAALAVDALPLPLPTFDLPGLPLRVGRTESGTFLLLAAWLVPTAGAWWIGLTALRRSSGAKHRNRVRYLLSALTGCLVGDLLVLHGGTPHVYVGLAARLLGVAIVSLAVLRYDLPDLQRLGLSVLRVVLLSGLTAGVYLGALLGAGYVVGAWSDLWRVAGAWPALGLVLALTAVADVTLGPHLQRFLNRIILGRNYDVQKALQDYSRQINLILDLERLAATTLDWLRATLRVKRSAFILLNPRPDAEQVQLDVLHTTMEAPPASQAFDAESRFLAHFRNVRQPLSQYDLDMLSWFQAMPADERQWLQDLGLDLYIPILAADEPVALLGLGPKASGQPYAEDDLETLMTLAGQTGTALENARLLDDLRAVQSDLHRLSDELVETNQQLRRLDQVKTDFITIASHELRTPLTQIYGYSDILTRMQGDDMGDAQAVHQFVEGITRGASRLKRVVDAMVDMSLIESGSLNIHPITLPVGVVVQNAVETVQPVATERGLTITVEDLSELPYIEADSSRLEQVFTGLLTNAVKFTPDGGQITIRGQVQRPGTKEAAVELQVADTGIGIDPEEQKLIFRKFHRGEDLLRHSSDDVAFKGAGPGLGLAITRGLVQAHGGQIWVESPGRDEEACPGSTFYVRLPVNVSSEGGD